MNILILSCGTRNKVVQYFKDAVGPSGKVLRPIAARMHPRFMMQILSTSSLE